MASCELEPPFKPDIPDADANDIRTAGSCFEEYDEEDDEDGDEERRDPGNDLLLFATWH